MRKFLLVLAVLAGSAGIGGAAQASQAPAIDPALVQTVQYRGPGPYAQRGFEPRRFGGYGPSRRHFAYRHDGFRGRGFQGRPGFVPGRRF